MLLLYAAHAIGWSKLERHHLQRECSIDEPGQSKTCEQNRNDHGGLSSILPPCEDHCDRQQGGGNDQLTELDAQVKREQTSNETRLRQAHFAQHAGKTETVDQAKEECD